jgi:hypothetical protein
MRRAAVIEIDHRGRVMRRGRAESRVELVYMADKLGLSERQFLGSAGESPIQELLPDRTIAQKLRAGIRAARS